MDIKEGSKIEFILLGFENPHLLYKARAYSDMKIRDDSIMYINGGIYISDNNCVEKENCIYKIKVWLQDSYVAMNGKLYESQNDV